MDNTKSYERIENGSKSIVTRAAGLAEINAAMMGDGRKAVHAMWSRNSTDYVIDYKDRRSVRLTLIDTPTPDGMKTVTVKGKRYIVKSITPARPRTADAKWWIPAPFVSYWTERDGKPFGPTRHASEDSRPGTVSAAVWAQASK